MAKYNFARRPNGNRMFYVILAAIFAVAIFFFLFNFLGDTKGSAPQAPQETVAETPQVNVAAPVQAQITATRVNMRDAPGTQTGKVVHRFAGSEHVVVLDKTQSDDKGFVWYRVRFETHEGWVYGQYVTVDTPVVPE